MQQSKNEPVVQSGEAKEKSNVEGNDFSKVILQSLFFFFYKIELLSEKGCNASLGNYERKNIVSRGIDLSKILWCPNLREKEILFETNCRTWVAKSNICLWR